jgi:RNA polymerase sigma factor (TIGR02999 family)
VLIRRQEKGWPLETCPANVDALLAAWGEGEPGALDRLVPAIYAQLRRIAKRHLRRQTPGHTLQATALVHEAYLKLANLQRVRGATRLQLLSLASQAMRSALVDHARRRLYAKRGGGAERVSLSEVSMAATSQNDEVVAVDEALHSLAALDQRKATIVEMRYFGGLTVEETAETLGISTITVKREWLQAKAWLYRGLGGQAPKES